MEHGVPHSLTTPRGTITFNAYTGDYTRITSVETGKTVRSAVSDLAMRDGYLVPDGYQGGVYVALEVELVADTLADRRSLSDQLTSYLASILRADGTHKWTPSGSGGRQRTVRAFMLPDPRSSGGVLHTAQFVLVAADPTAYSQTLQQSADMTVNTSPPGTTYNITNGGDTPVHPTVRFHGATTGGATDLVIHNYTAGNFIRFDDTASIASGKYWEIDYRAETVIDSDGVSRIGKVDPTVSEFFQLDPGVNNIGFDGSSVSGGKGVVYWRDGWSD